MNQLPKKHTLQVYTYKNTKNNMLHLERIDKTE